MQICNFKFPILSYPLIKQVFSSLKCLLKAYQKIGVRQKTHPQGTNWLRLETSDNWQRELINWSSSSRHGILKGLRRLHDNHVDKHRDYISINQLLCDGSFAMQKRDRLNKISSNINNCNVRCYDQQLYFIYIIQEGKHKLVQWCYVGSFFHIITVL